MITKFKKPVAAGGTTIENEPVIKSDGASSDVMQWLSNDESSNITISEDASNNLDLVVSAGNAVIGGQLTGAGATFSPNTAGKDTFTLTTNASNDGRLLIKSDTTTKVDIQANGDSYFKGGNVGVGAAPSHQLQLEQSAPELAFYDLQSGSRNWAVRVGDAAVGDFCIKQSNAEDGNPISAGTTRLTISNAGVSTFSKDVNITSDANVYLSLDTTQANGDEWQVLNAVGGTTSNLQFKNIDQSKTVLMLDENGNVGINNTDSSHALEVTGGIVERGGCLKENLLSNSGLSVWSNSTLEDVGSDLAVGGDFSDTADWTEETGWAVTGGNAVATSAGANQQIYQSLSGITVGKLYKAVLTCSAYTSGNVAVRFDGVDGNLLTGTGTSTVVVEATTATPSFGLVTRTGSSSLTCSSITLYEVTPGCVAADSKAMDGWKKDTSNLTLERYHWDGGASGSVGDSKDGSFYTAKMVSTAAKVVYWNTMTGTDLDWLARWKGRTVTLGAWVKSSVAAKGSLTVYTNAGSSTATTTGTGWEWLETTYAITAGSTAVLFWIKSDTATTFVSQPMLVFGSAIGEGNYSKPSGEIVWFENHNVTSNKFNAKTGANGFSDTSPSMTALNLEADSNGVIPKGAKAIQAYVACRDAVSSGNTYTRFAFGVDNTYASQSITNAGLANDVYTIGQTWADCTSDGDIYYHIQASGSNTFDIEAFKYFAVQLR